MTEISLPTNDFSCAACASLEVTSWKVSGPVSRSHSPFGAGRRRGSEVIWYIAIRLPAFLTSRTFMAFSSPESTSPALIGLPGFEGGGASSSCCAEMAGVTSNSIVATKANRVAKSFVMSSVPSSLDG